MGQGTQWATLLKTNTVEWGLSSYIDISNTDIYNTGCSYIYYERKIHPHKVNSKVIIYRII